MNKKKIAIIGTIDGQYKNISGQYDRTEIIRDGLITKKYHVIFVNMLNWRNSPFSTLIEITRAYLKSDVTIFVASLRGTKVLLTILSLLRCFKKRAVIKIAIGGASNVNFINSSKYYRNLVKKLDAVCVEVKSMVVDYNAAGIDKVYYLPNCKKIRIKKEAISNSKTSRPFRFCTYSRITPNKGIESAIFATEELNRLYGGNYCKLDIYGTYLQQDEQWFKTVMTEASSAITYKGKIRREDSIEVLSQYSLMLFPTHHMGEGVPGGMIDCYEAGLPIIVHDTSYMREIVRDGITGFVYTDGLNNGLVGAILKYTNSLDIKSKEQMRENCQKESMLYEADRVVQDLVDIIEEK